MDNLPLDPQAIIFIVVALIGFIHSTFFKKKKKEEQPYDQPRPFEPTTAEDDDPLGDFRRMIQEARAEAEQKKAPAPVVAERAPQLVIPPVQPPEEPVATPYATTPVDLPAPRASAFPPSGSPKRKTTKKQPGELTINSLLSSPSASRKAIILTEVLGKPMGLR